MVSVEFAELFFSFLLSNSTFVKNLLFVFVISFGELTIHFRRICSEIERQNRVNLFVLLNLCYSLKSQVLFYEPHVGKLQKCIQNLRKRHTLYIFFNLSNIGIEMPI